MKNQWSGFIDSSFSNSTPTEMASKVTVLLTCDPQWAAASASPVSVKNADSQVSPYACIWVSERPPGALEVSAWSPGLDLKERQTCVWLPRAFLSSFPGEGVIAPGLLFFSVLRRSNDTINEKCSAEDRVHGNRKASLAHWQLAGPTPLARESSPSLQPN